MLLIKLALRSLLTQKEKTFIVGTVLILASFFAVMGSALVFEIAKGMQRSLTQSLTGDFQIYSSQSKNKLSIFGDENGTHEDIGSLASYKKISKELLQVPNVKAVVPMGVNFAMVNPGNILDVKVETLRKEFQKKQPDLLKIKELEEHIRAIALSIQRDFLKNAPFIIGNDIKEIKEANDALQRSVSDNFWNQFSTNPEANCEFLANKVAPLIVDDNMLYMSYIGTIPKKFQESFTQFQMAKGTMIPEGQRGFLFTDNFYEHENKHKIAKRFDEIKKAIEKESALISKSQELKDKVKANISQVSEIITQLTPKRSSELVLLLQNFLKIKGESLKSLLETFLDLNDQNFGERHTFFYNEIAPHIVLYKIKIGDVFAITSFTKSGGSRSVNLKVYGTYKFRSFENSPIATSFNLMDLISFRDLYGFVTKERESEQSALEKEMGLEDISMSDMFKKREVEVKKTGTTLDNAALTSLSKGASLKQNQFDKVYSQDELEDGPILNAGILLHDPKLINKTMADVVKLLPEVKTSTWKESAGIVGQLIFVINLLLYLFIFVVFLVAAFIIMNAVVMSMLARYKEIGTMRAIGAQKSFILSLLLFETIIQSLFFAAIGSLLAMLVIGVVGHYGIPATNDIATFFFSGPRLYLTINPLQIIIVMVIVSIISSLAALYPAYRATKVSPVVAMGK